MCAPRLPGQWFQSEAALHQNWMRDYDPTTGRYIQADPLGLVDGASVYGYVGQNPAGRIDRHGLADISIGFDIDLTGVLGAEFGFGVVADLNAPLNSGLFFSGGYGFGANVGIGLGATYSNCEIEGRTWGADVNALLVSFYGGEAFGDGICSCDNPFYFGASIGLGLGGSANLSNTNSFTFNDYIDLVLGR